jgi:hypothetical protein
MSPVLFGGTALADTTPLAAIYVGDERLWAPPAPVTALARRNEVLVPGVQSFGTTAGYNRLLDPRNVHIVPTATTGTLSQNAPNADNPSDEPDAPYWTWTPETAGEVTITFDSECELSPSGVAYRAATRIRVNLDTTTNVRVSVTATLLDADGNTINSSSIGQNMAPNTWGRVTSAQMSFSSSKGPAVAVRYDLTMDVEGATLDIGPGGFGSGSNYYYNGASKYPSSGYGVVWNGEPDASTSTVRQTRPQVSRPSPQITLEPAGGPSLDYPRWVHWSWAMSAGSNTTVTIYSGTTSTSDRVPTVTPGAPLHVILDIYFGVAPRINPTITRYVATTATTAITLTGIVAGWNRVDVWWDAHEGATAATARWAMSVNVVSSPDARLHIGFGPHLIESFETRPEDVDLPYFDGDTPDTPEIVYDWTGTYQESPSTATPR